MLNRRQLLVVVLGTLAAYPVAALAKEHTGFGGKWVLDKKNTPSLGEAPEGLIQEIKTDAKEMVIRSRFPEPSSSVYPLSMVGIMASEIKLATDGSESSNYIGPFLHKSKSTLEGNTLTTDWSAATDKGQVNGKWVRTVSDDGRSMTLKITAQGAAGQQKTADLLFIRK